jgi:PAS domain S-box-containing protein
LVKILYATVSAAGEDITPAQLTRLEQSLEITTVVGAAEALGELRRKVSYHALMMSPAFPRNEALALIATLRRDRVPVAIVPVVTESDQDFLAPAIAAGADDVLLLRGHALVHAAETLTRIRQSPHLRPVDERRRLHVVYCGDDPQVWELLEMAPFVSAEQVRCAPDGSCAALGAVPGERATPCDVVVIDERPGDAHPLQVVKTIKAQASDMPVIVLTSAGAGDIGTAALDLGADDTVIKSGIYRRRLVASLHRLHQRLEITAQHAAMRVREARMRQIVETLPEGVTSIDGTGVILAMNAAGLALVGAVKPRDVIGRPFVTLVVPEQREEVAALIERICGGDRGEVAFDVDTTSGRRRLELRGVMLERDARGGRGVVAVLRSAVPAANGADLERLDAELRQAREALKATEARRNQSEDTMRAERQAHSAADAELERLTRELKAAAALRVELESSLEAARNQSRDAISTLEEERASWEQARRELDSQRASLEAARKAEREQWESQSGSLERRLREAAAAGARAEVETMREAARVDLERLSETLAEERHRFANEHDRFAAEREDWTQERRTLTAAIDEARAAVGPDPDADRTIAALRSQLEQERDAARAAEARSADLEQALEAASAERDAHTSALERLTSDRDFLAADRDDLERRLDENQAFAEERTVLEATLEATRIELSQAVEALQKIDAERAGVLQELQTTNGDRRTIASERDLLQSEVDGLRSEVDRLRTDLDRACTERDEERAAAEARADAAASLDATSSLLEDTLATHAAERAGWDETRRDLEARLADLERAAQSRQDQIATLDTERGALEQTIGTLHAERAAWETTRLELDRRLAETRTSIDDERAGWDETRRDLEARLADLERTAQSRQDRIATLDAERGALEQTIGTLHAERAAWEAARAELDRQLNETETSIAADREVWNDARRHLEAELADAKEAAAGLEEARVTVDQLRDELRRVAEAHATAREAWDTARVERDEQTRVAETVRAAERERWDAARRDLEERLRQAGHRAAEAAAVEERLRRAQLDAESRIAAVQSDERLARLSLEARLGEAADRIVRLTEEAGSLRSGLTSALAAAEADRDRLLDSGVFGQAVMTLDGRLVRCNDAFAKIFGYRSADDARSRAGDGPFAPAAGRDQLDARLLAEGQVSRLETWLTRADGQPIRVIESATIVPGQAGDPPLVERIFIDVSTQSTLEARLRQASRLEEAGRLAAAMAPEIDALLVAIGEHGARIAEATSSDPHREGVQAIRTSAVRAGELVRQLLAFSRRQMRPTEVVDINDLVHRSEALLGRLAGPHVGFHVDTVPLPPVVGNEDDLDELLTGLVVAARDLLPVGGSIRVETGVLDPARRETDDDMPDPVIRLAVIASGYGVQVAQHTWALELATQRCGGTLHPGGDPDHTSLLEAHLPGSPVEPPPFEKRMAKQDVELTD